MSDKRRKLQIKNKEKKLIHKKLKAVLYWLAHNLQSTGWGRKTVLVLSGVSQGSGPVIVKLVVIKEDSAGRPIVFMLLKVMVCFGRCKAKGANCQI